MTANSHFNPYPAKIAKEIFGTDHKNLSKAIIMWPTSCNNARDGGIKWDGWKTSIHPVCADFICTYFQNSRWIFGSCRFPLFWRSESFICAQTSDDVYYWLHLYGFLFGFYPQESTKQGQVEAFFRRYSKTFSLWFIKRVIVFSFFHVI